MIEKIAVLDLESTVLLNQYAEKMLFSARGYHKILKIARTIADLDSSEKLKKFILLKQLLIENRANFRYQINNHLFFLHKD
ncbi:Mg chelatase-related protein [Candidatus Liberibacter solanacearum CLso-ZC1]|uniref:Mg chelatase-related protein n=1 Tax=Liberibacter solanacearum (strain CLso-ZC1) TaxID=658172 RepID=E4UDC6_LIBSC|nr:Mg chelatase-related protein [Candidatus Liberibacter solanacearum CLso-ZC1]